MISSGRVQFRYIAVEGPIGAGKTTLSERLSTRLDATLVLEETENPYLRRLLRRSPRRGAAGAAVLPAQSSSPADHPQAGRSLQPDHDLRLPVRQGQDLRLPEPRRQRTVHLPAALRSARPRRAAARSRDLSAGADRRPAAAHPQPARPIPRPGTVRARCRLPHRAERGLSPLLLPLQRDAAAGRRNLGVRFRGQRRGDSTTWSSRSGRWASGRATTCRGQSEW